VSATLVGLASSVVLLLTISRQVYTQWKSRATAGMSRWLFIGQLVASAGFSVYSWMLANWIFLATNLMLIIAALIGQLIYLHNRRHAPPGSPPTVG
jgi:MtN3 and saliva related transmembrane protein